MPNRRLVLVALAAGAAAAGLTRPATALDTIPYTQDALAELQAGGEPFLIDFFATWCTTCAAQERVLEGLVMEDPAYRAVPIMRVDWDEHGNGELARSLAIPRRSTLVLMRGTTELGRLVAETRKDRIAALLDLSRG
jgi:thiol-disulfide isomerase/thioredoxin